MSNFQQIIVWFLVCLVLAIYASASGFAPRQILGGSGAVLGQQSKNPGFGPLLRQQP